VLQRALPVMLARPVLRGPPAEPPALSRPNPLSLDGAIKLALENNQRVKVSAFSPPDRRAPTCSRLGTDDPAITFNVLYSEAESPGLIAPFTRRPAVADGRLLLSARWRGCRGA